MSASLSFVTVDVFTTTRYKGNPLAIVQVSEEDEPSTEAMQLIAREFNLSETVFLYQGRLGADGVQEWRMRIFITEAELPFAGHPTIGTACHALSILANDAPHGRFHCPAGIIEVDFADGIARASIPHNVHVHASQAVSTEQVYHLQPALASKNVKLQQVKVVSPVKGMSFIMVELPDLEALAYIQLSAKPKAQRDDGWDQGFLGSYFYVVTSKEDAQWKIRTRMIEGSFEDPATGSAACALGAYLAMQAGSSLRFEITQGVEMGRQSDIGVSVALKDATTVSRIELSGSAVAVMEGTVKL